MRHQGPNFKCQGSMVAIVTPMDSSTYEVDYKGLDNLVRWHVEQGTKAIVAVGTTGEAPTLDQLERTLVLRTCVEAANGAIPVIAGTGTNCTKTTIENTRLALVHRADAALIVTPYYNKPTQEGLYQHYKSVAEAVPSLPIILYNVPSRTACDLLPETVQRLARDFRNIVGIKEACGKLERFKKLREVCGDDFLIYSGEDGNCAMDIFEGGADGVISVTANVMPKRMSEMCEAALKKDGDGARHINEILAPLHRTLFIEPSPTAVKFALAGSGMIEDAIRQPLLALSPCHHESVRKAVMIASGAVSLQNGNM